MLDKDNYHKYGKICQEYNAYCQILESEVDRIKEIIFKVWGCNGDSAYYSYVYDISFRDMMFKANLEDWSTKNPWPPGYYGFNYREGFPMIFFFMSDEDIEFYLRNQRKVWEEEQNKVNNKVIQDMNLRENALKKLTEEEKRVLKL